MEYPNEAVVAERLTLVSSVEGFELLEPQFIQAGERFWVDWDTSELVVQDSQGGPRRYPRKPMGPDSIR